MKEASWNRAFLSEYPLRSRFFYR